jgi:hypothetical protein
VDRLANTLAGLPVARRQSARRVLYAKVLSQLPDGFPAVPADVSARQAARKTFQLGIGEIGDG